jgi:hypothetical protein
MGTSNSVTPQQGAISSRQLQAESSPRGELCVPGCTQGLRCQRCLADPVESRERGLKGRSETCVLKALGDHHTSNCQIFSNNSSPRHSSGGLGHDREVQIFKLLLCLEAISQFALQDNQTAALGEQNEVHLAETMAIKVTEFKPLAVDGLREGLGDSIFIDETKLFGYKSWPTMRNAAWPLTSLCLDEPNYSAARGQLRVSRSRAERPGNGSPQKTAVVLCGAEKARSLSKRTSRGAFDGRSIRRFSFIPGFIRIREALLAYASSPRV